MAGKHTKVFPVDVAILPQAHREDTSGPSAPFFMIIGAGAVEGPESVKHVDRQAVGQNEQRHPPMNECQVSYGCVEPGRREAGKAPDCARVPRRGRRLARVLPLSPSQNLLPCLRSSTAHRHELGRFLRVRSENEMSARGVVVKAEFRVPPFPFSLQQIVNPVSLCLLCHLDSAMLVKIVEVPLVLEDLGGHAGHLGEVACSRRSDV